MSVYSAPPEGSQYYGYPQGYGQDTGSAFAPLTAEQVQVHATHAAYQQYYQQQYQAHLDAQASMAQRKHIRINPVPPDARNEDILESFSEFGDVVSVSHKDGVGFVNFKDEASAGHAIASSNRISVKGTTVTVKADIPKHNTETARSAIAAVAAVLPVTGCSVVDLQSSLPEFNDKYGSLGTLRGFLEQHPGRFLIDAADSVFPITQQEAYTYNNPHQTSSMLWGTPTGGGGGATYDNSTAGDKRKVSHEPDRSTGVGLFNLPLKTTEAELQGLFSSYEGFTRLRMISKDGTFKGFAFAYFLTEDNAATARAHLLQLASNNHWGQKVDVKFAVQNNFGGPDGQQQQQPTKRHRPNNDMPTGPYSAYPDFTPHHTPMNGGRPPPPAYNPPMSSARPSTSTNYPQQPGTAGTWHAN